MGESMISKNTYSVCSEEESSWAFYLDELLPENNYDQMITNCDYQETNNDVTDDNSLVSKAGRKKVCGDDYGFCWDNNYKKLSFKKRKKEAFLDDSLEDTASSPVSSPKVGYFSDHSERSVKEKHLITIPKEKSGYGSSEYTELRKRGLCLVPVSSLANYFP